MAITTEQILNYVSKTPGNTNPNVLALMLKAYQLADSDEIREEVFSELNNRLYGTGGENNL